MKHLLAFLRVISGLILIAVSFLILIDPRRFALAVSSVAAGIPDNIFLILIIILATTVFTLGVMISSGLRAGSLPFTALALLMTLDSVFNLPRMDIYRHSIGTDESGLVSPYGQSVATVVWDASRLDDEYWDRVREMRRMSTDFGKSFYILTDTVANLNFGPFSRVDSVMARRAVSQGEIRVSPGQDLMHCYFMSIVRIADRNLLQEMMPSNGGALIFTDGIIADKIPQRKIYSKAMLDTMASDADFAVADNSAMERVFFFGVLVLLFLMILVIDHVVRHRKLSK